VTRAARRPLPALALALALGVAGCAALRPEPPPPVRAVPIPADDPLPAALLSGWEATVGARRALRGSAALKLEGPGGSQRLRQDVVLARPDRLRMEIRSFLMTAAVLVADGRRYDYFQGHDRYRERGRVGPDLLWSIAGIPLTLEQAVHFLLGGPPPRPGLAVAAAERLTDGTVRVDLADARGVRVRRMEFDADGRLRRAADWTPAGRLRWEVGYDRYGDVGEEPFAHTIDFAFPRVETRARVAFGSVELDPRIPDGTFVLDLPGDADGDGAEAP